MFADYPNSSQSKQIVLSFFGHHIEDEDVLKVFKETGKETQKASLFAKLSMLVRMPLMVLMGPRNLIKDVDYYMYKNRYNMIDKLREKKTPKDIFNAILEEHLRINGVTLKNHGPVSFGSSMKTMLLRKALEGAQSISHFINFPLKLVLNNETM